jgi:hypothetical protein
MWNLRRYLGYCADRYWVFYLRPSEAGAEESYRESEAAYLRVPQNEIPNTDLELSSETISSGSAF